mmetsp:Transcript_7979/g.18503  ORF Transcript_7979/g.18503 Transcript_7979/m.18503 type:complete len:439 (-) Transcript_7979:183-1499(-)
MASLAESQAFLTNFDKCLPLCERGDAATVINALHTLNSITKASIKQAIELELHKDFACTFLIEMELALELHTAPVPRLGTIDGGLPELYSFTDEELEALSNTPSLLTKDRVRKFLDALGETPSARFDERSVADTVVAFLKCQVKPTSRVAPAKLTLDMRGHKISWADMCSSGSESDSDDDVPGLEDDSDCENDCEEDEVQVVVKPAPPQVEAPQLAAAVSEELRSGSEEDDSDQDSDEEDTAARIFLWAAPSKVAADSWFPSEEAAARSEGHSSDDEPRKRAISKDDPLYKTRVCAYFQTTGACHFGERCNFAHGSEDLRTVAEPVSGRRSSDVADSDTTSICSSVDLNALLGLPDFKTRMCRNFQTGGCKYGDRCNFAHGPDEMVGIAKKEKKGGKGDKGGEKDVFKTRLCSTFLEKGSCWYGAACSFAHGKSDLRK